MIHGNAPQTSNLLFLVGPFTIFILKQFRLDNFIHQSVEKGISIKTKKEVLHLFTLRILNSLNCTFSRFNSCEKALHLKKTVVYVNLGACFATFYFFSTNQYQEKEGFLTACYSIFLLQNMNGIKKQIFLMFSIFSRYYSTY